MVVAAIGCGLIAWANDRLGRIGREVDASVSQLATTLERTAEALHDASTTAGTFSSTLDQGATSMPAISQQIAGVRTDLGALEGQLRSVSFFGATPLAMGADAVGRIGLGLEGIDTQLSLAAVVLGANRDALAANSASIGRLGDSTEALAARLRSGVIEDSFGDVQQVILLMLLVFTAVSVVPAVGAIVLGVWLRRTLAGSGPGPGLGSGPGSGPGSGSGSGPGPGSPSGLA